MNETSTIRENKHIVMILHKNDKETWPDIRKLV